MINSALKIASCLWEAGVKGELLSLSYLLNKISLIEPKPWKLKHGTCNGLIILSSLSVGDTKNSLSFGTCIRNYKVGPLALVDDIAYPKRRYMLKQSHANTAQFASKKKIRV